MKTDIITIDNKKDGQIELSDKIFKSDIRKDILHRMVRWQLAKRRSGTHKAKERNAISGSQAKISSQKGTGRARHSTRKVVQFRGGGVVHGPRPRDHAHNLSKKIRKLAMCVALSSKVKEGIFIVIISFSAKDHKTKNISKKLLNLGVESAFLIGGLNVEKNFRLAVNNIPRIDLVTVAGANVYDILRREMLVISLDGLEELQRRLA